MADLSDQQLRALLADDPARAWRAFIDERTPAILAHIERAGIADRDEAMEVYVLVCEHLSEGDCARLRRYDPGKGTLRAWLGVVIHRVVVDWIRSRAGRRRLFGVVKTLEPLDQRVFELYYWDHRSPGEIAELLGTAKDRRVSLSDVLGALDRIDRVLTERHRSDLLSLAARSRALSLDADPHLGRDLRDEEDPEHQLAVRQTDEALRAAIAGLAPEDAALVRLKFVQGLSYREITRALHLGGPAEERMRAVLDVLRQRLASTVLEGGGLGKVAFLTGGDE